MVDQNSDAPSTPQNPKSSHTPSSENTMSAPSVVKAGEMMLIFGLVMVFLVIFFVALHLFLKRKKRYRRKPKKEEKKKRGMKAEGQPELHSQEKKIAELVGTPVCEIGESEPRHELEDVEVHEQHTTTSPSEQSPLPSAYDVDLENGTATSYGTHTSRAVPETREFAVYWSARL